jgi:hypothetical protein
MIKFIQCIRKKPELSHVEFRRLWAEYRERAAAVAEATGVTRFSISTMLTVAHNVHVQLERGTVAPFDGVAEFWFPKAAGLEEVFERPEVVKRVTVMRELQEQIADLKQSVFFFASEEVVSG